MNEDHFCSYGCLTCLERKQGRGSAVATTTTAYEQLVQRIIVGHPTDTAAEMLRLLDKAVQDGQRLVLTDEEAARGVKADLGLGWERVSER